MKSIFNIPFFQYSIENWGEVKDKILQEYDNSLLEKVNSQDPGTSELYTDFFKVCNLDRAPAYTEKVFEILNNYITKFINDLYFHNMYAKDKRDLRIGCAWFEKLEKSMSHIVHNHGSLGFSSVCYIKYNNHQATTFVSPFGDFAWGNTMYFQPNVKEGDIIFFPSFLQHYAPTNTSNEERIIFSFNIK